MVHTIVMFGGSVMVQGSSTGVRMTPPYMQHYAQSTPLMQEYALPICDAALPHLGAYPITLSIDLGFRVTNWRSHARFTKIITNNDRLQPLGKSSFGFVFAYHIPSCKRYCHQLLCWFFRGDGTAVAHVVQVLYRTTKS